MTQYGTTGSGGAGERWNVNLPAVIGVVFVFLVGVIVWVIASGGGDDEPGAASDESTTTIAAAPDGGASTSTPSTSPASTPEPTSATSPAPASTAPETSTTTSTTVAPTTAPAPTAPATTAPVTTAPGAQPDSVPGDLAIPGRQMQRPACDGSYITILASAVGAQATPDGIGALLDSYPDSEYLRTDQTCSSLRPNVSGEPIYVVYFGPFPFDTDACAARAGGPDGAYAKQLSNEVPSDQVVNCG